MVRSLSLCCFYTSDRSFKLYSDIGEFHSSGHLQIAEIEGLVCTLFLHLMTSWHKVMATDFLYFVIRAYYLSSGLFCKHIGLVSFLILFLFFLHR